MRISDWSSDVCSSDLGQDQTAGVPVEQRYPKALFEVADLPADRRLAQIQRVPGMREAAGLGDRMKDAQLVPVHDPPADTVAATGRAPYLYTRATVGLTPSAATRNPPTRPRGYYAAAAGWRQETRRVRQE